MASRATFEVQVFKDDHWVVHDLRETEAAALALAKKLFENKQLQGARVVRSWERADGVITETVVMSDMRTPEDKPVQIVPIESAPMCETERDFYRLPSRMVVNRLLRNYLQKVFLTPTEIFHNYRELKRLQDTDMLYPSAVDRVATLQAKQAGEDPRQRKDDLHRSIAQMSKRARRMCEHPNLPDLGDGNFSRVVERAELLAGSDERDYMALVVLSRDLVGNRSWLGKLHRMMELAAADPSPEAMGLLDGALADLLNIPTALQDVLGAQPNLAGALMRGIDLYEGKLALGANDDPDVVTLNHLMAADRLPATRAALLDRIQRQVASGHALRVRDPEGEEKALRALVERLTTPDGLIGAADTAEALTQRCVQMSEQGGRTGRVEAIRQMLTMAADDRARISYLIDFAGSGMGQEHMAEVIRFLRANIEGRALDGMFAARLTPREKLASITRLYYRLAAAALPDGQAEELAGALDGVLARYLSEQQIIEKLDRPEALLRERATHLVQFCGSDLLPRQGKAVRRARDRVLALLRQPRFDETFVEGIADPAEQQRTLRRFHELLTRAGFGG